jgi:hypothetical protein
MFLLAILSIIKSKIILTTQPDTYKLLLFSGTGLFLSLSPRWVEAIFKLCILASKSDRVLLRGVQFTFVQLTNIQRIQP